MMTPGDAYNHCQDITHDHESESTFYQILIDVIEDTDHTIRPKEHR